MLEGMRKLVDEATQMPWFSIDTKDSWSLHGEARDWKSKNPDKPGPGMQILKAPKHGTPYAEYWPNWADGGLILEAVNRFPFFLDWADDVAKRHYPVACTCKRVHLLCAEDRRYNWDQCPEVIALVRALERLHGGG